MDTVRRRHSRAPSAVLPLYAALFAESGPAVLATRVGSAEPLRDTGDN